MIKKSFTMIEMIFVILIVAVLAIFVTPKFCGDACGKSADLIKAANQVLGHIRYTRHLAMVDNKFVPNSALSQYTDSNQEKKESRFWFKGWWQIKFYNYSSAYPYVRYSIFSDKPTTTDISSNSGYSRDPDKREKLAINPLNGKYLSVYADKYEDERDETLNLTTTYSVYDIVFSSSCGSTTRRILFDNIGRPHCQQDAYNSTNNNPYINLLTTKASIELKQDNQCIYIHIEPETGYSYIDYEKDCSI